MLEIVTEGVNLLLKSDAVGIQAYNLLALDVVVTLLVPLHLSVVVKYDPVGKFVVAIL